MFHTFDVGWAWQNFAGGLVGVFLTFYGGVALARLRALRPPSLNTPSILYLTLLLAALCIPLTNRIAHLYELAAVLIVFPTLIYLGSGAKERAPQLGKLLGDASYAAYAIHLPLIYFALRLVCGPKPIGGYAISTRLEPLAAVSFAVVTLGVAWLVDYAYDQRLRRRRSV